MFERGGNAIDAAWRCRHGLHQMYDDVSQRAAQALIYDPRAKKVVGINALGMAPTARRRNF
jgi:gamma-glutamyltranspeptidase/glutathione hydrolase